jgi:hypothetical protein
MTILEKVDGTPDIKHTNPNNNPGIAVFRIDYLLKEVDWRANIAAYSAEEAEQYLKELFGPIQVKSIGMETRLDAISNELRQTILTGSKRKPGRPKKKVE